jgi:hypothetical protein
VRLIRVFQQVHSLSCCTRARKLHLGVPRANLTTANTPRAPVPLTARVPAPPRDRAVFGRRNHWSRAAASGTGGPSAGTSGPVEQENLTAQYAATAPRKRVPWYYLFIPLLAIILPAALWHLADQPQAVRLDGNQWVADTGAYAGDKACQECHADHVSRHLVSNHAITIRDLSQDKPLAPFDGKQAVVDPLTGARYSMKQVDGRPHIAIAQGGLDATQELAYEFGSGAHAFGYLARLDDRSWVDTRLNYYHKIHAWGFTSSQDKPQRFLLTQPLGRPQDTSQALRCFACHATVIRAQGLGSSPPDGSQLRIRGDRSVLGVGCEACHGPRADHVRDFRAGKPPGYGGQ